MKLTPNFIESMAEVFYDKDIEIYGPVNTIKDAEGGIKRVKGDYKKSAKVNISFTNLEEMRKEYGLEVYISASLSCKPNTLALGDIIVYENNEYEVIGLLPFDSHQKVGVKKRGN